MQGKRLADRLVDAWWADFPVAALIAGGSGLAAHYARGLDVLGNLTLADRRGIYNSTITATAIFAVAVSVAFAVYLGMNGRGVAAVKRAAGAKLLRVWMSALVTPWIAAAVIIAANAMDRGDYHSPNLSRVVVTATAGIVAMQLVRLSWVFYQLASLELAGVPAARPTSARPVNVVRRTAV